MNFAVLTIFPEMCRSFFEYGIVRRAIQGGKAAAVAIDIREFTTDRHHTTDDRPYGGGCGMVMKPEPLAEAIRAAKRQSPESTVVLLSPRGRIFNQSMARVFAACSGLVLVCGRYEGVDARICRNLIDDEVSIGDYVMSGGEPGALVVMDAVIRLIPGALGGEDSADKESFSDYLLEHDHYTRPPCFEGEDVPEVLLSGNHAEIDKWRQETALMYTVLKRPDLLKNRCLSPSERDVLARWHREIENLIHGQSVCGAGSLSGGQ
ncbi:MAG: tRNA (guanosine(37)-N1)-methyltransferase TrmD [Desulfobacterales bacterium]|jgi:tRNA (guanine37-N1)-methyltransferase|nr:tRNA (guanosine(37)-N1)-methyltransferase TrmD [Desulfobacterales bacterium]